jgi:hypothetical protein
MDNLETTYNSLSEYNEDVQSQTLSQVDEANDNGETQSEPLILDSTVRRGILSEKKDITLEQFQLWKNNGELILQPEYQRNFVATSAISSRLIESVLMDVPIPIIYLAEEQDGTYSVIDGQQRLSSFLFFMEGKTPDGQDFRLSTLEVLKELNRKTFQLLSGEEKRKIRNTSIPTIIIKKESDEDIKFAIFERLNTGSTKLNEDELRNTIYRGPYISLLKELSEFPLLHELFRKDEQRKRMEYRGHVLRFLALSERRHLYKSSMKQFCNKELRDNIQIGTEKANDYRKRFKHCLEACEQVFKNKAFRRYQSGVNEESGDWIENVNMALYDLQMVGFVRYDKNQIMRKKDEIYEAMLNLMIENKDFQLLIAFKTSDTHNVEKRFRIWDDTLSAIMDEARMQARVFPFTLKKKLFEQNPICAISGQSIANIEDAEVDHITPYSQGGPTEEANAQLVLRYFNRQRGNRPLESN